MKRLTALSFMLTLVLTLSACNGESIPKIPENPESDFNYLVYTTPAVPMDMDLYMGEHVEDVIDRPVSDLFIGIKKYIGTATSVRIPEKIEGCSVTTIQYAAFSKCNVTNIYIPASVTKIRGGAFKNCNELLNLTYGGSLKPGIVFQLGGYLWRVLDVQGDKALVLSENIIGYKEYHKYGQNQEMPATTWEECILRNYLNGEFYNSLNSDFKTLIVETKVKNPDTVNPISSRVENGGNDTKDKIFLLSLDEYIQYLQNYDSYDCAYATQAFDFYGTENHWWLRSPGNDTLINGTRVAYVDSFGVKKDNGCTFNSTLGVRPALWLKLPNEKNEDTISLIKSVPTGLYNVGGTFTEDDLIQFSGDMADVIKSVSDAANNFFDALFG